MQLSSCRVFLTVTWCWQTVFGFVARPSGCRSALCGVAAMQSRQSCTTTSALAMTVTEHLSTGKGQQAALNQMRQFHRIKDAGGMITDVYAKAAGDEKFYFTGKLATGVIALEEAIAIESELVTDHIRKVVRDLPAPLQFFAAPGGSEMAVAQNQISLRKLEPRAVPASSGSSRILREVGFNPEIYQRADNVFYTRRADDGSCIAAAVQANVKSVAEIEQQMQDKTL